MDKEFINVKLPRKNKDGKYNMCKAIRDLVEESELRGEKRGEEKGEIRGFKNGEIIGAEKTLLHNIQTLMRKTNQSFEAVCNLLDVAPADMVRFEKMI